MYFILQSTCTIRAQLLRNKTQNCNRNGTGSVVLAAKNIVAFQRLLIAKKTILGPNKRLLYKHFAKRSYFFYLLNNQAVLKIIYIFKSIQITILYKDHQSGS